ncbi:MAG: hypothetical protein KGJ13_11485, partial [Patescibacteria group bacterium]|nr:hypothetical protein [Patescibacteria group bacterium]
MSNYPWYRWIIPTIFTWITNHPRELVTPEWSKKSWTHNVFRAYELIFGRRAGIRAEISSFFHKGTFRQVSHTFEGQCALIETWV